MVLYISFFFKKKHAFSERQHDGTNFRKVDFEKKISIYKSHSHILYGRIVYYIIYSCIPILRMTK